MKLNKLIKKIPSYNRLDILDSCSKRLFPIDKVENYEIKDFKKYRVLEITTFKSEPGVITIYVKELNK